MINYVIDLDGTLAQYQRGDVKKYGIGYIGDPIPGAVEFVNTLAKSGKITIFTVRMNFKEEGIEDNKAKQEKIYNSIKTWLDNNGFVWHEIWQGQGKPNGTAFIDDRGVGCRPQEDEDAYEQTLKYINSRILNKGF